MTGIKVERKGPSVWPWIAGLVALALLIWALMELFGRNAPEVLEDEPIVAAPRQGPPSLELRVFIGYRLIL
jgi:hypothetical protein